MGVKVKSILVSIAAALAVAGASLPAYAQGATDAEWDAIRASAAEKINSGLGSELTGLERLSLGYEGCLAYASAADCPPEQLANDKALYGSLTYEEWAMLSPAEQEIANQILSY